MSIIKETILHPDGNEGVDLYPKTNINQVQELPQKLTSIENQIGQLNVNKLTKPVTPTAESAVTMLADGTVGTKPLSEISGGGGGGKLYLHYILKTTGDVPVYFSLWSSSTDKLTTVDKLFEYYQVPQYQNRLISCSCGGISTNKIGVLILDYTTGMSKTATITYTDSNGVKTETISANLTDVVTEV